MGFRRFFHNVTRAAVAPAAFFTGGTLGADLALRGPQANLKRDVLLDAGGLAAGAGIAASGIVAGGAAAGSAAAAGSTLLSKNAHSFGDAIGSTLFGRMGGKPPETFNGYEAPYGDPSPAPKGFSEYIPQGVSAFTIISAVAGILILVLLLKRK